MTISYKLVIQKLTDGYGNLRFAGLLGAREKGASLQREALDADNKILTSLLDPKLLNDKEGFSKLLAQEKNKLSYVGRSQLEQYVTTTEQGLKDASAAWDQFYKAQKEKLASTQTGIKALGTSFKTLGKNILAMSANMLAIIAIVKGIELITKAIDNAAHASERAIEAAENMRTSWDELDNAQKNAEETVAEKGERFLELNKGVDAEGHNLSLTSEQYEEYISLSNEIAGIFPMMVQGFNEQGNAILNTTDWLADLNEQLKELQRNTRSQKLDLLFKTDEDTGKTGFEGITAQLFAGGSGHVGSYTQLGQLKNTKAQIGALWGADSRSTAGYLYREFNPDDALEKIEGLDDLVVAINDIELTEAYGIPEIQEAVENARAEANEIFDGAYNLDDTGIVGELETKVSGLWEALMGAFSKAISEQERLVVSDLADLRAISAMALEGAFDIGGDANWGGGDLANGYSDTLKAALTRGIGMIPAEVFGQIGSPEGLQQFYKDYFAEIADNQKYTSALENLSLTKTAYDKGEATVGQLEVAKKALRGSVTDENSKLFKGLPELVQSYADSRVEAVYNALAEELEMEEDGKANQQARDLFNSVLTGKHIAAIYAMMNAKTLGGMLGGQKKEDGFNALVAEIDRTEAYRDSITALNEAYEGFIENRKTAAELVNKETLTPEDYTSLAEAGYGKAAQYNPLTGGYDMNYRQYREIGEQKAAEEIAKLQKTRSESQEEYNKLLEEATELLADQEKAEESLAKAKDKAARMQELDAEIQRSKLMEASYRRMASALQAWRDAKNFGESGDEFREMKGAIDDLREGLDEGRIGTNKFRAALELIFGKAALNWDEATLKDKLGASLGELEKFYKDGGNLDIDKLNSDWESKGVLTSYADPSAGKKRYRFADDMTSIDKVAKTLGQPKELVGYMIGALGEYVKDGAESLYGQFTDGAEFLPEDENAALDANTSALEALTSAINAAVERQQEKTEQWEGEEQPRDDKGKAKSESKEDEEQPITQEEGDNGPVAGAGSDTSGTTLPPNIDADEVNQETEAIQKLAQAQEQLATAQEHLALTEAELAQAQADRDAALASVQTLQDRLTQAEAELAAQAQGDLAEINSLKTALQNTQDGLVQAQARCDSLEAALASAQAERDTAQAQVAQLEQTVQKLEAQIPERYWSKHEAEYRQQIETLAGADGDPLADVLALELLKQELQKKLEEVQGMEGLLDPDAFSNVTAIIQSLIDAANAAQLQTAQQAQSSETEGEADKNNAWAEERVQYWNENEAEYQRQINTVAESDVNALIKEKTLEGIRSGLQKQLEEARGMEEAFDANAFADVTNKIQSLIDAASSALDDLATSNPTKRPTEQTLPDGNELGIGEEGVLVPLEVDSAEANQKIEATCEAAQEPATKPVDADTSAAMQGVAALDAAAGRSVTKNISISVSGPPGLNLGGAGGKGGVQNTNNSAMADGTVNARGGSTLVAELGPEIIVDRKTGTWRIAKEPQLTSLNKGDIVFNAHDTEKILARRGGAAQGKSFADGRLPSRKRLPNGAPFRYHYIEDYNGESVSWGDRPVDEVSWGDGPGDKPKRSGGGGGSGGSDAEEKVKEVFDWIQRALDAAKKATQKLIKEAAKQVGYIAKNKEIDKALRANKREIEQNRAGYNRYQEHLRSLESEYGFGPDVVKRVKNGEIDLHKYDEDLRKQLEDYIKWNDLAEQCLDTIDELEEQERELNLTKLDNIIEHYDQLIERQEASLELSSAERDYKVAKGKEVTADDYAADLKASKKRIHELQEARAVYKRRFDSLVANGTLKVNSDEWHEYIAKLEDFDQQLIEAKTDMAELNNEIAEIPLRNLQYAFDRLSHIQQTLEGEQGFHDAQGTDNTYESYVNLIRNGMAQIANLEQQNAYLHKQQAGLDVLSERWQEIQQQIEGNEQSILDVKTSQEAWNDAVADLNIQKLQDERDELEKTNDELQRKKDLQQAIEDLEKARSQRNKLVYRENIGFVYEADQDAIRDAEDRLSELQHQELLNKIDDAIDAIEDNKKDDNVYDYTGTSIIKDIDSINGEELYKRVRETLNMDILLADKAATVERSAIATNASTGAVFQFGDIMLYGVQDTDSLAQSIVNELPNKIVQKMYGR